MLVGEKVLPERFSDDFTRLLRRYQVRTMHGVRGILLLGSLLQQSWAHP